MHEVLKFIGGVAWIIGIIFLFLLPPAGVIILLVAVALTVRSVTMTREKRHQELLDAARGAKKEHPPA